MPQIATVGLVDGLGDNGANGTQDPEATPRLHRGEDLDVPTYIRRGVALN